MLADIASAVGLGLILIILGGWSVTVNYRPPKSQRAKLLTDVVIGVLSIIALLLTGWQSWRNDVATLTARREVTDAVSNSERRIRTSQEESAADIRALQLQNTGQTAYLRGQLEAQGVVIGLVLKNSDPERIAAALRGRRTAPAQRPATLLSTGLHGLDNSKLRTMVLAKVAGIRGLLKTYDSLSSTLSQEQYAAVANAVVDVHQQSLPEYPPLSRQLLEALKRGHGERTLTIAQRADLDRLVANNPKKFSKLDTKKLVTISDAALAIADADAQFIHDPLMPERLNEEYTMKELGNLQTLLSSFQNDYRVDAEMYSNEMLSRLPKSAGNAQLDYGAVPVSPSQIVAIADDLERLAKLLPSG